MKLFDGLESIVKLEEPLAPRTWFHIGGKAEYFVEPQSLDQLPISSSACRNVPPTIGNSLASPSIISLAGVIG